MNDSPKHIADILNELIKEHGWEHSIAAHKLPELWNDLLGDKAQSMCIFQRFDEGKLYIHVTSAPWRNELTLRKIELLQKLNQKIGYSLVKEIIFR
ncbi:MAG: DUF721 domain-containing protein [Candidatus Kapaibacteriota bacterium]|jgi:predicted nucleic acid-binding Zn ribbon protein